MCFPTVFTVIYLTSVFASTDAQSAKPTLTRTPEFDVLYRGESVTFTCGVNLSSKWNILWFHNGTEITGSTSTSTYTIAAIDHPSSGEYVCRASESVEPFSTGQSDPLTLQVFDLAPPVLKLESQWPDVFEDESVELFCDADTGIFDLTFTWYRNKEQLQDDSVVVLDQMEPTLNITAIGRAHQGSYACQIHLESRTVKSELSNTVNITVYEILVPSLRNLTWTDVFHGEKVEMSCGMNDGLAWTYTWYKDGQEVHADQVVSFDTNKATLSISSASAAFKGEYKCRGHLNNRPVSTNFSSGVILSVYDEMPKVTLTQDPEYKVIFVGESVVFSCHVSASTGWEYMWTKDSSLLSHTENKLTISPQESSDQGSYECQAKRGTNRLFPEAKSEVVNIKVEESKPKPLVTQQPDAEKVYIGESLSFKCEIKDSAGWEYSWFKDGKQITVSGSKFDIPQARLADSGTYECMGTRSKTKYGSLHSDRRVINISGIPAPEVKKQMPWSDVFPTENVSLSCEMDDSKDWTFTWYKDGQEVHADQVVSFDTNKATLSISSASAAFKGEYKCKGHLNNRPVSTSFSSGVILSVYDEMPKVTLTQDPEYKVIFVGESVVFSCHVSASTGWEYMWTKDSSLLSHTENKLTISPQESSDQGSYECQAKRGTNRLFPEAKSEVVNIKVEESKPKPLVTQQPDAEKVYIGESLSFKCEIKDSAGWEYSWFKDGKQITISGNTFDISQARLADNGTYECMGTRSKTKYGSLRSDRRVINISGIPAPEVKKQMPWSDVFPTENVSLSCEMDDSKDWTFTWYKDGQEVHADQVVSFDTKKATLSITSASATFKGEYKCKGHLNNRPVSTSSSSGVILSVYESEAKPLTTQQPDAEKVYIGESLSFKCEIKGSAGWEYSWFKDGKQITFTSNKVDIPQARLADSGTYECMGTRNISNYGSLHSDRRVINISEIPSPKLAKKTSWLDVFPTESVRLSCEMDGSSDWMFTWYRDRQKVHAGQGVSFDQDATVLSINSASASHRGQYSCSGKHKQRPVSSNITSGLQLDVYDTKPKVQLTQTHSYTLMYTEESVSFLCHINVSTGWEFVWYKDDSPITLPGNNLTISSVLLHNAGSYKCQARRGTSPTFSSDPSPTKTLSVEERPKAQILLLTGWSQAFSTDSLVLSCTVHESRYEWNYTWFKDGQEIGQAPSPDMKTYTVTPQDDPEQSVYSCRGTTNERPLNSTISDQFKTKNLLLKRRVLLSIAGCIVFGISAVCLGCIFLRVFRKPAEEEYKPEEVDLFLRMDALKDSDDGPCPLVQYITESALNTSLKEEGENGTISSGTPLPETAQDETDATTESPDAVENHNGGLVSFQQ